MITSIHISVIVTTFNHLATKIHTKTAEDMTLTAQTHEIVSASIIQKTAAKDVSLMAHVILPLTLSNTLLVLRQAPTIRQ